MTTLKGKEAEEFSKKADLNYKKSKERKEWIKNMKHVLNRIEEDLNSIKHHNECMVSRSWVYQEGILITGKEAKEMVKFIKSKLKLNKDQH